MPFRLQRIYQPSSNADGFRVLIDRLWPRGLSKQAAAVDLWLKEIAPSTELRKWFNHDAAKWTEFQSRYRRELEAQPEAFECLRSLGAGGAVVTLLFATREERYHHGVVLLQLLS
ncbi:MAG: DUF488 family protein [Bryobacteraceae bacterium]